MPNVLHTIDYLVLTGYLLFIIYICVRVTRRSPDADDLFLAGRQLGWPVIGLSLFASNISSTTLIGLPGAAWQSGIAVANYEWMAAVVLLLSMLFVVPLFLRARLTTVPELLERRFDARLRKYLSAVTIALSILLDTAGSLYAGSLVLMLFFPQLTLGPTCAAIALFAGLYTAAGGLRAVAYTDVVQALMLLFGSIVLTAILFGQFDWSWHALTAQIAPERLSLMRPLDDPELPWLGTLVGLPILGFYYWTMNQYVSQRLLAARDMREAGFGALLAAALKLLPLFFMVLPGVMASVLLPDLERADQVFPQLIADYAPAGIAGLILAGLLAAIMSSIDSALNSSSTLISVDFILPRRPDLSAKALARTGRIVTLSLVAVAALWAPLIDQFPGLFRYLQLGFTYIASPLVATFLLALFNRRVGADAAFWGTVGGHLFSLAWFVGDRLGWLTLHFTIVAGVLCLFTALLTLLLQRILGTAPAPAQLEVISRRHGQRDSPFNVPPTVRVGAMIVLAATLLLVVAFW